MFIDLDLLLKIVVHVVKFFEDLILTIITSTSLPAVILLFLYLFRHCINKLFQRIISFEIGSKNLKMVLKDPDISKDVKEIYIKQHFKAKNDLATMNEMIAILNEQIRIVIKTAMPKSGHAFEPNLASENTIIFLFDKILNTLEPLQVDFEKEMKILESAKKELLDRNASFNEATFYLHNFLGTLEQNWMEIDPNDFSLFKGIRRKINDLID